MRAHLHLATTALGAGCSARPEFPVRVVLAEDHPVMRRSLRMLLDADEDFELIAQAADLSAAVHHVHRHRPHVLVLDLHVPNGSSIEAIRRLRAQMPETEIVV